MPFSSTTISSGPYTPNGITTNFPYFFLALTEDEVQVVLTDAAGVETILTNGFEITDIGNPEGGVVIFTMAPLYAGQTLSVRAVPSFAQETDFGNQGAYNPVEINRALDRAAQRSIYLRDVLLAGGAPSEGGLTTVTWASIQGKPTVFTPAAHVHAGEDIASGTVAAARIANLDATKVVSGAFDPARIPGVDASKITSGTIDLARLPPQSGGVVAPTNIASLTAPQQALIVEGTLVTTSDGRQWRYKGTGSKVLEASYTELSTATGWGALTSVPANITSLAGLVLAANKGLYATGVGTLVTYDLTATGRAIAALASQNAAIAYTSPLTTKGDIYGYGASPGRLAVGANGQVLTADSVEALGVKWANPPSGTGGSNMPLFTSVFSGNGDGVTSNDAAFTAAEASSYERIWLPEGRYATSKVRTALLKRYEGPGRIVYTGGTANQLRTFTTSIPWVYGTDAEYGANKTSQFSDYEDFKVTGGRIAFGTFNYFDAVSTPKFTKWMTTGADGGFSGTQAHLTATANAGQPTVTLNSVAGLTAGMQIVVSQNEPGPADNYNAGPIATGELKTIAGGGISGLNVTFTTNLANTYTVSGSDFAPTYLSGYAQSPQVTRGKRTMNTKDLVIFDHNVAGDGYVWTARVIGGYVPTAGQTDFFDTSTSGMIGGDITLTQSGIYATGWEMAYLDNGNDVAMIGFVNSYVRTNGTGARRVAWGHDFAKSSGVPIDFVYLFHGAAKVGIDFTFANFSSEGERAMQLKLDQRIYFDGSATAGAASIGVKGRGFRGDVAGAMYLYGWNNAGVKVLEMQNGGYRMRLFANGSITTNTALTAAGNIASLGTLTGTALQIGDANNGLFLEGGLLKLKRGGVVVATF